MAGQGRLRRVFCARVWASVVLFLSLVATAWAFSPQVQHGVTWLAGQVQSTGALTNENSSVAAPLQNRDESLRTLLQLSPGSATPDVTQDDYSATEYLAREILSFNAKGTDATTQLAALVTQQNADGGFGPSVGYGSDALNSAWALAALVKQSSIYSSQISTLKTYLFSQMWADGGIGGTTSRTAIEATSLTLMGLEATTSDLPTINAMQQLSVWLAQQQSTDGSWGEDPYLTGYSLLALSPLSADTTMQQTASTYLLAAQAGDGSWSDDPFLTAVVLRALGQSSTAATLNNTVTGQVISAGSGQPLSGVAVTVAGSTVATTTNDTGNFTLQNVAIGNQVLSLALAGFQSSNVTIVAPASGAVALGTLPLTAVAGTGILAGTVIDGSTQQALAGATITVAGNPPLSAQSDATGHFQISNISAGTVSLSVAASGHTTVSASANISSGSTTLYQPSLYAPGSGPASGPSSITGQVVAQGSNLPLANVQVLVNQNALTSTDSNGKLSLSLSAGSYTLSFMESGYNTVTQQVTVNGGDSESLGIIYLAPQLTSSSITGQITDASTQKPVAGATVQVVGGSSTTSDANGNYNLSGLSGLLFSFRVSAPGYNSQTAQLQLNQPMLASQNFALSAQAGQGVSLAPLMTSPATASLNTPILMATTYTNAGSSSAVVVPTLQVFNALGKVVSTAYAYSSPTATVPMGAFTLAAGGSQPVYFQWNSGQFAPGQYTVVAYASLSGTLVSGNALGTIIAEQQGSLSITGQALLSGSLTANPPVQQATTATSLLSVQVSGVLQNAGNIPTTTQAATVQFVDQSTNNVVASLPATLPAMVVQQLSSVSLAAWTAPVPGSFKVSLLDASGNNLGINTTVYIGQAATGAFTVTPPVVPTGTQTVQAQVSLNGVNSVTAILNNPLSVAIKQAISGAVNYDDPATINWLNTHGGCIGCHIVSQAMMGGETSYQITPGNYDDRQIMLNTVKQNQHGDGSIWRYGATIEETLLFQWGMSAWHNPAAVLPNLISAGDYIVNQQGNSGIPNGWRWDHCDSSQEGWFYLSDYSSNAIADYNLNHVMQEAINNPTAFQSTTAAASWGLGIYGGYSGPNTITLDENGIPYLEMQDGVGVWHIAKISLDGQGNYTFLGALPAEAQYFRVRNGLIYANIGGSISVYDFSGNAQAQSYSGGYGPFDLDSTGKIYAVSSDHNNIYTLSGGTATPALQGFGSIIALAISKTDQVNFATSQSVFRLNADGTTSNLATFNNQVYSLGVGNDGSLIVGGGGSSSLTIVTPAGGITSGYGGTFSAAVQLQDGSYLLSKGAAETYQDGYQHLINLKFVPYSSAQVAAMVASYGPAIEKSWTYWQGVLKTLPPISTSQGYGGGCQPEAAGHASSGDYAFTLIALGNIAQYFDFTNQPTQATTVRSYIPNLVSALQKSQFTSTDPKINGGWDESFWRAGVTDPLTTAIVGYSLQYANLSPNDPMLVNAISYELNNKQGQGTSSFWQSSYMQTDVAATDWVAIFLPIALNQIAGINSDLYLTFPSTTTMASPTLAPADTLVNSDGSTRYHWNFANLQQAGQTLNFNLTMANLLPNEVRPAALDAHLSFANSFTGDTVSEPLAIPTVTASAGLALTVATNQTSYGANNPVAITANVNNVGVGAENGSVHMVVYAADGTQVADLGSQPFTGLAPTAQDALAGSWNTGLLLPNTYYVQATLLDANGNTVSTQKASFAITSTSSSASGAIVGAGVTTDKASYGPLDTVNLDDRITNLTNNTLVGALTLNTTITGPSGTVIWTMPPATLQQLPPGGLKDITASIPVNGAAAGVYTTSLTVTDSTGAPQGSATGHYTVTSTASTGQGISGSLSLGGASWSGHNLIKGDVLTINATVSNKGNAAVSNLPVTITLLDPVSNAVVTQWTDTIASLAVGGSAPLSHSWPSAGNYGQSFVVVVNSSLSTSVALAQGVVTLVKPPLALGYSSDKTAYDINTTATLTTTLASAAPIPVGGLTLSEQVQRADGSVFWQTSVPGINLAANGSLTPPRVDPVALGVTAPGTYTALESVLDANGVVLTQATKSFQVNSTASDGAGLTGTLSGLTGITAGSTASLGFSVANAGNAGLLNLPAQIVITNATTNSPVATLPTTIASLAMGGSVPGQLTWNSSGTTSTTPLQAALQVQVGTGWVTLVQQPFSLLKPLVTNTFSGVVSTGYAYNAPVAVTATIQNQSTVAINAATITWTLTDPTGALINTSTVKPAPTLAAGSPLPEVFSYNFNNAAPGNYSLGLSVTGNGEPLMTSSTPLVVQSTAQTGAGLAGTLNGLSGITAGSTANVGFTVADVGNAGLSNLPVQILITNSSVVGGAPLATLSSTLATVANNGVSSTGGVVWNTSPITSTTPLQATLQVQVGSGWITLISQPVTLLKPVVVTGITGVSATGYAYNGTVNVSATIQNQSTVAINAATITWTLTSPSGVVLDSKTVSPAPTLAAGKPSLANYSYVFSNAAPGNYGLSISVSGNGESLGGDNKPLLVTSSAQTGAGLGGTLTATPVSPTLGQTVVLGEALSNAGNAPLTNLPVTLTINQGTTVVQTFSDTVASLAMGATNQTLSHNWVPTAAGSYTLKLSATLGSTSLPLATQTLTVAQTAVKISVSPVPGAHARLLVYFGCQLGEHEGQDGQSNQDSHNQNGNSNSSESGNDRDDDDKGNSCLSQRQATLTSYLNSLNVPYTLVSDDASFTQAFRSGRYNNYWLLGSITKVEDDLTDELREAVNRGDSLVIDSGAQGNANYALYHIAGVQYQGHLEFGNGGSNNTLSFTAPVYSDLVGSKLSAQATSLYFNVQSGAVAAYWTGKQCSRVDPDSEGNGQGGSSNGDGHGGSTTPAQLPAIVSGQYGQGKTLALAFDLAASLQAASSTTTPVNGGWSKALADNISYSTPAVQTRALIPGELYSASFPVQNQGQATSLYLYLTQPTGGSYLSASQSGTVQSNGSELFSASLSSNQLYSLITDQTAPLATGSYSLNLSAQTNANPPTVLGSYPYSLTVGASQASRITTVNSEINAITSSKDNGQALSQAKSFFATAQSALSRKDLGAAIDALADAGENLGQISGTPATQARADLDLLLKLVESQWLPPAQGNGQGEGQHGH